jgi:hypothetical protein
VVTRLRRTTTSKRADHFAITPRVANAVDILTGENLRHSVKFTRRLRLFLHVAVRMIIVGEQVWRDVFRYSASEAAAILDVKVTVHV